MASLHPALSCASLPWFRYPLRYTIWCRYSGQGAKHTTHTGKRPERLWAQLTLVLISPARVPSIYFASTSFESLKKCEHKSRNTAAHNHGWTYHKRCILHFPVEYYWGDVLKYIETCWKQEAIFIMILLWCRDGLYTCCWSFGPIWIILSILKWFSALIT